MEICYVTKHMILLPLGLSKEADDDFDKILMEIHENCDIYFDDPIHLLSKPPTISPVTA